MQVLTRILRRAGFRVRADEPGWVMSAAGDASCMVRVSPFGRTPDAHFVVG